MGENSKIEWTDHTFNPWIGCTKVAAGCEHCYAEAHAKRTGQATWGPQGTRVKTSATYWQQPVKWNRAAEVAGERRRVFCASLADVFEDWDGPIVGSKGEPYFADDCGGFFSPMLPPGHMRPATMDDVRAELFALIDATPWLDWLLLTKRPENVRRMWPMMGDERSEARGQNSDPRSPISDLFRETVWLLTSIATQADADRNVPLLQACRDLAPVLGLSCEPLLGPIHLVHLGLNRRQQREQSFDSPLSSVQIDWVIVGGESGPHARPMHPDWARSLRDGCEAAGVPFFFKQWGEWREGIVAPYAREGNPANVLYADGRIVERNEDFTVETARDMRRRDGRPIFVTCVGKKVAGRLLDGRAYDEYPQLRTADV